MAAQQHRPTHHEQPLENGGLLTPSEVAKLFRVDPRTVTRWAQAGKLSSLTTLGGHRRYRRDEVERLLEVNSSEEED